MITMTKERKQKQLEMALASEGTDINICYEMWGKPSAFITEEGLYLVDVTPTAKQLGFAFVRKFNLVTGKRETENVEVRTLEGNSTSINLDGELFSL